MTRSISRTLEYSYNDYCIAQVARGVSDTPDEDAIKYLGRSSNWQNLFRDDQVSSLPASTNSSANSTTYTGFFQPKYLNGTWGYQDPLKCSNIDTDPNSACSLTNNGPETFESSIWEYSFFVPHDQAGLIERMGGREEFVRRLDALHDARVTYIGESLSGHFSTSLFSPL